MSKTSFADSPTKASRRFHALTREFAEPLGGMDTLTTVEQTMVRSAATLVLRLEQLQESMMAGQTVRPEVLVRLNSEARRALTVLRRAKGKKAHFNGADPLTDLKAWANST